MRIIAGDYRRRNLFSPPGMTTRPIPDRVKEALFSMLGTRIEGASFLDCFAGSGAIGLEALSRGASSCIFVEKDRHSADTLQKNIDMLGETCIERATLVRGDALGLSVIARCPRPLDLAFFDPPYPLIQTRLGWERVTRQCTAVGSILADDGFLMLRTPLPHMVTDDTAEGESMDDRLKARRFKKHEKPRPVGGKWEKDDPRKLKKGKGAGPKGLVIDGEVVHPLTERELEEFGEGGELPDEDAAANAADALALPRNQPIFADWKIPGLRGPETHEYGSTAVHFYMKAKS